MSSRLQLSNLTSHESKLSASDSIRTACDISQLVSNKHSSSVNPQSSVGHNLCSIIEVPGSTKACTVDSQLETELTDFRTAPSKFKNSLAQYFTGKDNDSRPLLLNDAAVVVRKSVEEQDSCQRTMPGGTVGQIKPKSYIDDQKSTATMSDVSKKNVAVVFGDVPVCGGDLLRPQSYMVNGQNDVGVAELTHQVELMRIQLSLQVTLVFKYRTTVTAHNN